MSKNIGALKILFGLICLSMVGVTLRPGDSLDQLWAKRI
jgi:hypothetical protein